MLTLRITIDRGSDARPAQLETLVKAVRVATDVAETAEFIRARREATALMRHPSDRELHVAFERLAAADEQIHMSRVRQLLDTRSRLREALRRSPTFWYDLWEDVHHGKGQIPDWLRDTGYDRLLPEWPFARWAMPLPWSSPELVGLDIIDPATYDALVGDHLRHHAPPREITVREVAYRNPFITELAAADRIAESLKKAAGVIETVATIGSQRRLKRVEADIAEKTSDERVEGARLDNELKREQARRLQIENELLYEDLRWQRALHDHLLSQGRLDLAEALSEIDPADATALREFATWPLELDLRSDPDTNQ